MNHDSDGYNLNDFEDWEEGLIMKAYTADFETTTDLDDCRVWAFAVCEIDNPEHVEYGKDLNEFIEWCKNHANCQLYFHNLGFDGYFIIDWLERNNWLWVESNRAMTDFTYTTLISDANQLYCITLNFSKAFRVKIYDSLKIVPLSISAMAKAYNLPILKGEIDYNAYREVGYEMTDEEREYIKHDVQIAAMVMKSFLDEGLTKMTAGSNALYNYKKMLGGARYFRRMYPLLDEEQDNFIRQAYRGGFTYVNPKYAGKKIDSGIVFDVNSLYPSVMAACDGQLLPHGLPKWFDGEPKSDDRFNLWVASVTCSFKIKPNHIPCIQLKKNLRFKPTEYLEDSEGVVTFMITNVDWELIKQQYDLENVEWLGGYAFQSDNWMFQEYVNYWIEQKNQATREGNAGKRQIAKLMLNSLYGKFATRTTVKSRKPELIDDVVKYVDLDPEERDPVYLPVGVFITAYARYKTITSAQKVYDRFIYADTDSLHLIGTDIPDEIEVDDVELGKWKHESTFTEAKFLRAKCYVEHEEGKDGLTVHVAGMPARCHNNVTIDNFKFGAEYDGKLYTKRVKGGIVLVEDKMVIRENL
jgi:hypothetical protein